MKITKIITAISGALAVMLGAFGAHGLKPFLDDYQTDIYNKAVFYQLIHTIMVAVVAVSSPSGKWMKRSTVAMLLGILCFSGSLYLLATAHLTGLPKAFLGPITPIGGIFFIVGWIEIALGFYYDEK